MIGSLKPVSSAPVACKICGDSAALYGVVDFHKSCAELNGVRLPLSGIPIYYRRCGKCGFLFTDAFDDWDQDQFKRHIYNDGYRVVDPDYETARPRANGELVVQLWGAHKEQTRVLDYGGGNDAFCAVLRANGFPAATSYDPMTPQYAQLPEGKFDLVTCFETFEHLPDPAAGIAVILNHVAESGFIFYSTYTQPAEFDKIGLSWWYVGPRNGHISLFSKEALAVAWGRHGYRNVSLTENAHLAFRTMPPFAEHLSNQAKAVRVPS